MEARHYLYVYRCRFPTAESRVDIYIAIACVMRQIGGGVLGDCWKPEERGKAVALYSLAPLLGPVVGPVAGAWIAERSTWRWVVRSLGRRPHPFFSLLYSTVLVHEYR